MDSESRTCFKELADGQAAIIGWQKGHDAKHEAIARDQNDHHETLYGENGLKEAVIILKEHDKEHSKPTLFSRIFIPAASGLIASATFGLILWFLFIYKSH